MADRPLLIHIGFHKTGTTWLQDRLFKPDCGYAPLMSHADVFALITRPHALRFDPEPARALIALRAEQAGGLLPVVSSEILSGHPFWGGRESVDYAHRLKAIAPDARVLVTIRRQVPMIASVYMQYVRRAGRKSPRVFFTEEPVLGYNVFEPENFEYDRLVALYQSLFGAGRVHVMTQEKLAADPVGYIAELAAFSGSPMPQAKPSMARTGVSESEAAVPLLRRINIFTHDGAGTDPLVDLGGLARFCSRGVGWVFRRPVLAARLKGVKPVSAVSAALFSGRFAASNRRLLALCPGLELPGYDQ